MLKLSVITINLNNETGLDRTIKSIINQDFTNVELILIDGGSTDGSTEILEKYKGNTTYWISETDTGIYNAMNKGILKASGEYCFFLNSGDYFVDEKVLSNVFAHKFSEDIVQGNMLVCLNDKIIGRCTGKENLNFSDIYASIIKHQATFIKRELFNKFGFYNENLKIVADWEFFLRTIGFGGSSYRYIDIDISYFDNNGLSNNSGLTTKNERQRVIDNNIPTLMKSDFERLMKYREYEPVFENEISFLLLRLLKKMVKVYGILAKKG